MKPSQLYSSTICFYEPLFTIAGSPRMIEDFFRANWSVVEYTRQPAKDGNWAVRIDWAGTPDVPAREIRLRIDAEGEMILTGQAETPALFTLELVKKLIAEFPALEEEVWFLSNDDVAADYTSGSTDDELLLRIGGQVDDWADLENTKEEE